MSIASVMEAWKTLAREMSVRTFCTPDSVVRRHLHDTYRILEMLGANLATFLAFQEIALKATEIMDKARKSKEEQKTVKFGVERQWDPPWKSTEEWERLELKNPFA